MGSNGWIRVTQKASVPNLALPPLSTATDQYDWLAERVESQSPAKSSARRLLGAGLITDSSSGTAMSELSRVEPEGKNLGKDVEYLAAQVADSLQSIAINNPGALVSEDDAEAQRTDDT